MKKFLIAAGIPPVVAVLGAVISEYVLKIGVLGTANFKYFLIIGAVGAMLAFVIFKKLRLAVPVFIGFALIPYFAFFLGQIDFYMADDNLAEGMRVVEVRPTMDKITFGLPESQGEAVVWQGPQTLVLHPGENRVKLGRFNMAAGTYRGGAAHIGDIRVDIEADFSQMKNPKDGQNILPDYYAEVFGTLKSYMTGTVGGFTISLIDSSLQGAIGRFTLSAGKMTLPVPVPEIKYPGVGGPDVTLDLVLDEMGRPDPSKIKTIIDMPPGFQGAFPAMPGVEFR